MREINRRGQVWEELIPWLIAVGVLALGILLYFILSGKMGEAFEYLKSLFRFGT